MDAKESQLKKLTEISMLDLCTSLIKMVSFGQFLTMCLSNVDGKTVTWGLVALFTSSLRTEPKGIC